MKQPRKEEKGFRGRSSSGSVTMESVVRPEGWTGGYFPESGASGMEGLQVPLPELPSTALLSCHAGEALWIASSETGAFGAIFSWVRECRWFLPWFLSISCDHSHFHQQKFPGNSQNYQTYTMESEIRCNILVPYLLTYGR